MIREALGAIRSVTEAIGISESPLLTLLRDEYTTVYTNAELTAAPTDAEPGPGTRTTVGTQFSIPGPGGYLNWLRFGYPTLSMLYSKQFNYTEKLIVFAYFSGAGRNRGYDINGDKLSVDAIISDGNFLNVGQIDSTHSLTRPFSFGTPYRWYLVYRQSGVFFIADNELLAIVDRSHSYAQNAQFEWQKTTSNSDSNSQHNIHTLELRNQSGAGFGDNAFRQSYDANPVLNDTFTHDTSFHIRINVDTLPSGGNLVIEFAITDANNYWSVEVEPAGDIRIYEVVASVSTERANALVYLQSGDKLHISARSPYVQAYATNRSGAGAFYSVAGAITATDGKIAAVNSATISDLDIWPVDISGTSELAELEEIPQ